MPSNHSVAADAGMPPQLSNRSVKRHGRPWIAPSVTFAVTTLSSAFLLFQVQPLISKSILPAFGGSPAVWTTCMLFFQTLLFCGYAYAHVSEHFLKGSVRAATHLALIAAALLFLPIGTKIEAGAHADPALQILKLLTVSIGVPYFVLSSTGPLLQAWFTRVYPGRSPYRLYSLSNAASLTALLSYPFLVEPNLELQTQLGLWSKEFLFFSLCCGCATLQARRLPPAPFNETPIATVAAPPNPRPGMRTLLLWITLPAFASLMLLATTNHVCQDVAVIPFLWVVPLSLYLITFIICFDHERWYLRGVCSLFTAVVALVATLLHDLPFETNFVHEIVIFFSLMFGVCMLCHGELVRLRPAPSRLTLFYLMIAAGGALGGLFVSLVAPLIFSTFFEWKIGLVGGYLIAAILLLVHARSRWAERIGYQLPLAAAAAAGLVAVVLSEADTRRVPVAQTRNFYGEIRVIERATDDPAEHDLALYSGSVVHGVQYVRSDKRRQATAYYSPESGVGRALAYFQGRRDLRIGVIGLGVGTLATYASPGQTFRFYEINPEMLRLAQEHFTYLRECRGTVQIVLGDARLSLQHEPPQDFDLLVLDAFSGDAVPTHLLTKEAFEVYRRHLDADGVICVHLTNSYLDLSPVVRALARNQAWEFVFVATPEDLSRNLHEAEWMLLSRNRQFLTALSPFRTVGENDRPEREILWTDEYSNLFRIIK